MADRPSSGVAWWELNAYCGRLADFIINHIDKPYTAEECGHVLEIPVVTTVDELNDAIARTVDRVNRSGTG